MVVPSARRDVALSAFAHNCHLLTEKPLADSWDNARAIIDAARAAGRIHAVVQNRRYLGNVRRIRRFLDSGVIGAATSIHADFFVAAAFRRLSRGDASRAAARHGDPYVRRGPLHGERRAGERLLPGMGAAQFLVSAGLVGGRHLRARGRQDRFTYRGSWCADGLRTSWESAWRIVGERGSLIWDGCDELRAEVAGPVREACSTGSAARVPPLDPRDRVGGHLGVIQDFVAAVADGHRAGDARNRQYQEPGDGLRRDRKRRNRRRVEIAAWEG